MAASESVSKLVRTFYNREIDEFSVYLEGFGGIKISRTKDGLVSLFTDKNVRLGIDDHFTAFFDEHGFRGLHRKVADEETDVYMKYNVDYIQSPAGIRKLVQDMQKRKDTSIAMKLLLLVLYRGANWAFTETHSRSVKILKDSEATKLGMKSPCIYVKTRYVDRFLLPIYRKSLVFQNLIHRRRFKERPSKVFREQHYPGSEITKHPKKRKKS